MSCIPRPLAEYPISMHGVALSLVTAYNTLHYISRAE